MRHQLLNCLGPLASERVQDKYIVHGTQDERLLPSNLLEAAAAVVVQVLAVPGTSTGLNADDIEAIRKFDEKLRWETKELDVSAYSSETLVRACPEWAEIRNAAGACLATLGFSASAWESQKDAENSAGEHEHTKLAGSRSG